jgi:glycosyltransferase involved in cell wall biosynthesis
VVGGVEAVVGRHAALLAGAGHRVRIVAGRGRRTGVGSGRTTVPAVEFVRVPLADARAPRISALRRSLDAGEVPRALEAVEDELETALGAAFAGLDVLVAHNVCSLALNLPLTAALHRLVVRGAAPPLVAWHHDHALATARGAGAVLPAGHPWDLLRTAWPGMRHVAVSGARRRDLEQVYGPAAGEIRVVPNGIDHDAFLGVSAAGRAVVDRLSIPPGAAVLLAPVRITRRKRLELAIGAVAALRTAGDDVHLVVTGPPDPHEGPVEGYAVELVDLARALGVDRSVHLLSLEGTHPTDAVIADLYRVSDLLVVPSADEGFGLPVLEAGLARLPIVCTDLPVLRELAGGAATYLQARAGAAAWAEVIGRVLRDDGRVRLRRRIRASYSWEAIGATMLEPLIVEAAGARH